MKRHFAIPLAFALALAACDADAEDGEDDGLFNTELTVCPADSTVKGVDVSIYQGHPNWKKVRASGRQFGFARFSNGGEVDPTFKSNWRGMKEAGMVRGAYVYFQAKQDPIAQAERLLDAIGNPRSGDLPPVVDVEAGGSGGVPRDVLISKLHKWVDHVAKAQGRKPIIYSGSFWNYQVRSSAFEDDALLWVPNWDNPCPSLPSGWHRWKFWQYHVGSPGSVPGISAAIDMDRFNGTRAELLAFSSVPRREPTLAEEEATLMAAAYEGLGSSDVDGDGRADACALNRAGLVCFLSTGTSLSVKVDGPDLGDKVWSRDASFSTLRTADIDGDGRADVCGRGREGFRCWRSLGTSLAPGFTADLMSDAQNWDEPQYYGTIRMADVDGDGRADLCGRAAHGFRCWRSTGTGFGSQAIIGPEWSNAAGWDQIDNYGTIRMGDVNGDGLADVCGRNNKTMTCYLSDGAGFPTHVDAPDLGNPGFSEANNWATIRLADLDGDGRADLCARGNQRYACWLSLGTAFAATPAVITNLSDDNGWAANDNYATLRLGDIDGDGDLDLCGRRDSAPVKCWRWKGTGFGAGFDTGLLLADLGNFDQPRYYRTIRLADVDGDGRADLCVRRWGGLFCYRATDDGFAAKPAIDGPDWSDARGWGDEALYATIRIAGP